MCKCTDTDAASQDFESCYYNHDEFEKWNEKVISEQNRLNNSSTHNNTPPLLLSRLPLTEPRSKPSRDYEIPRGCDYSGALGYGVPVRSVPPGGGPATSNAPTGDNLNNTMVNLIKVIEDCITETKNMANNVQAALDPTTSRPYLGINPYGKHSRFKLPGPSKRERSAKRVLSNQYEDDPKGVKAAQSSMMKAFEKIGVRGNFSTDVVNKSLSYLYHKESGEEDVPGYVKDALRKQIHYVPPQLKETEGTTDFEKVFIDIDNKLLDFCSVLISIETWNADKEGQAKDDNLPRRIEYLLDAIIDVLYDKKYFTKDAVSSLKAHKIQLLENARKIQFAKYQRSLSPPPSPRLPVEHEYWKRFF